MREIRDYIAYQHGNPSVALIFLIIFKDKIKSLSSMPERIQLTPEQPWHDKEIGIKGFNIYFWVNQGSMTVHVIDVIFMGRNQNHTLRNTL